MRETFLEINNFRFRLVREGELNYYAYLNEDIIWNLKFKIGNNNIPEIEWHRFDKNFEQEGKRLRVAPMLYLKVLNELIPFKEFHSTPEGRNQEGLLFQQNLRIDNNCAFERSQNGQIYIYRKVLT